MKRTVLFVVLIVSMVCAGTASAGKIGFVNAEGVIARVDEGKAEVEKLGAWEKSARDQLGLLAEQYNKLREKAASQAAVATVDSVAALQAEETMLRRKIEDEKLAFDRQMNAKTEEYLMRIGSKVRTVVSDYGKANGFDAIFILEGQPLLYVSDQVELTEIMIRLYNERFPVR